MGRYLLYDLNDRTIFEVTWTLINDEGEELLKSSLEYSGNSRDDKLYFNLDLSDTDSGQYDL